METETVRPSLPSLPFELWIRVYRHRSALVIQSAYRRHALRRLHFSHALHPEWPRVRDAAVRAGVLRRVYPFPNVRREWRTEPTSWALPQDDLTELADDVEAPAMLWGAPAARLRT